MSSKDTRVCYGGLNDQGLPHGLSAGAVNFFLAYGEGHLQKYIERNMCRGPSAHQPASGPVYGPSKTPRLQQFVDLATNSGGMTPFFSLGDDVDNRLYKTQEEADEEEEEEQKHTLQQGEGLNCVVLRRTTNHHLAFTPQQQKQPLQVPIDATPSSMMGMTLSPATACCDVLQTTPASAVVCPAIRVEARTRSLPSKTPVATLFGRSSSLVNESGSVFGELSEKKAEVKSAHEGEVETGSWTAEGVKAHTDRGTLPDNKQHPTLGKGRGERAAQRRGREKRHDRSKNNLQLPSRLQNVNADNSSHASLISFALHEENTPAVTARTYYLSLRRHGGLTTRAVSRMEFHVGDHVIFDADRGVDLGEVFRCEEAAGEAQDGGGDRAAAVKVLRRATGDEVAEWSGTLVEREEEAVVECRAACEELGLTIHVAAAVFQFDRQKLIFMYESDRRVDFRSLLQVMFSKYRCRIWMERINATP